MRIAFAGTPEFAEIQLKALLSSSHEIVVVYTQPDKPAGRGQHLHASPVKQYALAHSIPVEQPTSLKSSEAQEIFKQYAPDVFIVAAYGLILPSVILKTPRLGCINVHASLLPRWRGASPIQQAILAGDQHSGVTLMQMDQGLDTGDILAQSATTLSPQETAESLHDKIALLGADLLLQHIDHLETLTPLKQDPQQVTHAHKITKAQAQIDWAKSAEEIERQIRAFNPWPIAYCVVNDQHIRIWEAEVVSLKNRRGAGNAEKPGTFVALEKGSPVIATGDGQGLCLIKGQLPGKNTMSFQDILRGHPHLFQPDTHLPELNT